MDLHDISRSCKTYGVQAYYIVQPLRSQFSLAQRLVDYWRTGPGGDFNPNRKEALELIRVVESFEQMEEEITTESGQRPSLIATDAKQHPWSKSFGEVRKIIAESEKPHLLIFGTGDGLDESVIIESDILLAPIKGVVEYNHLSVRAAAAIILDRLMGSEKDIRKE